ncbi:MAG: tail fiber domain-containing protein [Terracidiphilus sp.]|jgi:polyhydroxyalkanoate synthesis regulator phasin
MKNIGLAILVMCLGTLGSVAAQAQTENTAYGSGALKSNTTGRSNSAFGQGALQSNLTAAQNSALGASALIDNNYGYYDTAAGVSSLSQNSTGYNDSAFGFGALVRSTIGIFNTSAGYDSMMYNTQGWFNTTLGPWALASNTTGGWNIAVGIYAGYYNLDWTNYNIEIGSYGASTDNRVVRIGSGQTAFYAAGVDGTAIGGSIPLYINSNGQLGTVNSSIRFKEDVHDMAAASDGLMRLRPVTFRYKQPYADGSKPIDYGLIAEEVAEVYPDLVVKGADGQIQTVQYQKLTPMLLNELQKQHKQLEQQIAAVENHGEEIHRQKRSTAEQPEINQRLEKRLAALEAALPSGVAEARLATK